MLPLRAIPTRKGTSLRSIACSGLTRLPVRFLLKHLGLNINGQTLREHAEPWADGGVAARSMRRSTTGLPKPYVSRELTCGCPGLETLKAGKLVGRGSVIAGKPKYVANFRADWVQHMKDWLADEEIPLKPEVEDKHISFAYWNVLRRRISRRPRTVEKSKEFTLPKKIPEGFDDVVACFERGHDVNVFRSRGALDATLDEFHDKLFNDWGIQHFHLGKMRPSRKLSGRTGQCLYAIVRDDAVYFIAVLPHGHYVDLDLMQRVHDNWPALLTRHRFVSGSTNNEPLTEQQMRTLRAKGANFLTQMADGTQYLPPGGGYAPNGQSPFVTRASDWAFNMIDAFQRSVDAEVDHALAQINALGRTPSDPPTFVLEVDDNFTACALERAARIRIPLGSLLFR